MDSLGGLFKFFYNIIPGALFLFGLNFVGISVFSYLPQNNTEKIFWIIVIGIFFGFLGQGLMKTLKRRALNKWIFYELKIENTENGIYKSARTQVKSKLHLSPGELSKLTLISINDLL